jgi:DNA-binding NtrC family response regulator
MKKGFYNYFNTVFKRPSNFGAKCLRGIEDRFNDTYIKDDLNSLPEFSGIVGNSAAMRQVREDLLQLAKHDGGTILIQGETGTGKELVARAIHRMSPRTDEQFVIVRCAAIQETLVADELPGFKKEALTGAEGEQLGAVQLMDRGTLLLDEVTDMSAAVQTKLLFALRTREFEQFGGAPQRRVNVRVIATTNKDLQAEVRAGRFSGDLLDRLSAVSIHLPSLRERKEDIPMLAEHFLRRFSVEKKRTLQFTGHALATLQNYDYPGNVRELENVIERAIIVSNGPYITPLDLDWRAQIALAVPTVSRLKQASTRAQVNAERKVIIETLRRTAWNRLKAAKTLGVDAKTLRRKIRQYALTPDGDGLP